MFSAVLIGNRSEREARESGVCGNGDSVDMGESELLGLNDGEGEVVADGSDSRDPPLDSELDGEAEPEDGVIASDCHP